MNVVKFDPGPLVLADDPDRPKGLHVSHIIHDLCVTVDPKRYGGDEGLPWLKITAGLALEQQIEKVLSVAIPGGFRPGPIKKDGIWMSPDAVAMDPWRIREFKLTWYSLKTKPCPEHDVYWPWRVQMMAYCIGIESQIAELWPFHVNGDYPVGAPSPKLEPMVITFSEQELVENWTMLVNQAKYRGWL